MKKRKITLPDGRYLILYNFDDRAENRPDTESHAPQSETAPPGSASQAQGHKKMDR